VPAEQSCPLAHARPQAPQFARSVSRSRQTPVQLVRPAPQETWQVPAEHTCPLAQTRPQAPQWLLSVLRSRQTPEHSFSPAPQETWQPPLEQSCPLAQALRSEEHTSELQSQALF
jgi:hypothetical protein